jgi:hypothetical protein
MTLRIAVALALVLSCGTALAGGYYDSFDDGYYERDPNDPRYDANDPYWTDPNNAVLWDVDNPDWTIMEVLGDEFYATAAEDNWLRLWASAAVIPITFYGATVDDGDGDPNTSVTFYDDSADHYIVTRARNYDPDKGDIYLTMHGDYLHWNTYALNQDMNTDDPNDPCDGRLFTLASLNGTEFRGAPGGLHRTDLDNAVGFWMAMQWEGDGDPNNSYLRAAAWNGHKFAWDGVWDINNHVVTMWDPNDPIHRYWSEGLCGMASCGAPGNGSPGLGDAKFDEIEIRWGTFSNVSHTLHLAKIKSEDYGTVTIDPDLLDDPNNASTDPNVITDTDELRRYTYGTEIVLTATPAEGRGWKKWKIWDDPNHYPDPNYEASDTNAVIYLTMDRDYVVEAIFSCSADSSVLPPIGMVMLLLMLGVVVRRVQ